MPTLLLNKLPSKEVPSKTVITKKMPSKKSVKENSPLILLLVGVISAFLAAPSSELDGQIKSTTSAAVGELVIFDAGVSDADAYVWHVLPNTKNYRVIDGGKQLVFSATTEGEYLFICAMTKGGKVDLVVKRLVVGPGNKNTDFNITDNLPKDFDPVVAKQLARSFRFAVESKPATIDELFTRTQISNKVILNESLEVWKPFLQSVLDHCKQNMTNATIDDYYALWLKIADTLEKA
jgi:hypothetical protein